MAIKVANIYPLSKATVNTICLPKNPIRGGTPMNENKVIAKLIARTGFIKK